MRNVVVTLALLAASTAAAQQFTKPGAIANLGAPVELNRDGLFQDKYVKAGEDVFIGGQPTARALRELKAQGVTTVVNLRTPPEMAQIGFDESALLKELGIKYVYLPVRGNSAEFPYSPETLVKFTEAMKAADGKVLLHCTIAWRASHLWAAYLIKERGIGEEAALTYARAINLMDEHRMGSGDRQPVEDFLGRKLTTIRRPPPQ